MVPIEASAAAPLLRALHGQVLAAARTVQVRTFHAWFIPLVTHAPLPLLERLGLPARAELIEDTAPLRPALFRRFHQAVNADAGLRADFLALVAEHRRATLQKWLTSAWERAAEVECADAAGSLAGSVPPAAQLWPELAGLGNPRELLHSEPWRRQIDALARELGTAKGAEPRKSALRLRDAIDQPSDASFEQAWAGLFTQKGDLRAHLAMHPAATALADDLRLIGTMLAQDAAHRDHARMVRLARVLGAEFAALKRERGLADMPDLERAALAMLCDPEVSGWVQERLDQRVRHLLIDEFQDTSPLQWHALHGWLASYAGAGLAPSVFIVGDPKQSIYRFRRADPRVFDAAREFVVDGLQGHFLACDHTRRNAPAVLAAVNSVFDEACRLDGWEPFRQHTTEVASGGAVRLLPTWPRPGKTGAAAARTEWRDSLTEPRSEPEIALRRHEAATVADAVAGLIAQEQLRPGDVMVLARRRAPLGLVADALAALGVVHVMPEPAPLAEILEAQDLTALLDVLASPGHDLSLAQALKSPLFAASDDDLLWLSQHARLLKLPWLAALAWAVPTSPALLRARGLLAGWCEAATWLPPHDLIDRIVGEGELLQRLAAAVPEARRDTALHAVQSLLHAALTFDGGRYPSLYGFVRELKSGRAMAPAAVPSDCRPVAHRARCQGAGSARGVRDRCRQRCAAGRTCHAAGGLACRSQRTAPTGLHSQ
jgi:ATP-dependent helicase/nuclease subunit A